MNIRRFGGEAFVYGMSNGLDAVSSFVILFFLGRYLTPAELGVSEIITATGSLMLMVAGLNMDHALTRYYYDEPPEGQHSLASTHAVYIAITGGFMAVVGSLTVYGFRSDFVEHQAWVLGFLLIPIRGIGDHITALLRIRHEPGRHFVFMTVRMLAITGITLYALISLDEGITSIYLGRTIAGVLAAVVIACWLKKAYSWKIDTAQLRRSLRFAVPMIAASLAYWGMLHSPKYVLKFLSPTMDDVGYYGVGVRLSYVLSFLGLAVSMAWNPFAMSIKDTKGAGKTLGRGTLYFMVINVVIIVPFTAFSQEIVRGLMGPGWTAAADTVGPAMMAAMMANMVLMFFVSLSIAEKTRWISWSNVLGGGVMAILSIAVIPIVSRHYDHGAATVMAICTFAGETAAVGMMYVTAQRSFPIQVSLIRLIWVAAIPLTVYILSFGIKHLQTTPFDPFPLTLKAGLTVTGWGLCLLVLGPGEVKSATNLCRDILTRRNPRAEAGQ